MFVKSQILPTNLLSNKNFLHKLLYVVFAMCFLNPLLQAQTTKNNKPEEFTLSGTIINSETQKPVPHAEIFISGTTRGCISDMQGNFTLKVPYIPCTLVADHVSYESFITPIAINNNTIEITLKPAVFSIDEVKVSGKSNRKKNLRFFYTYFVGDKKNKIEILNDSVLCFKRTKDEFIAYTKEPLIIINYALGYKIKLRLKRFIIFRTEYPNGPRISINSYKGQFYVQITGYYLYEPIKTNSLEKILEYKHNRRSFYFGSDRHFLKSIYDGTHKQQGFEIETFPKRGNIKGIKRVENYNQYNSGRAFIIDCDSLKVSYHYGKDRYPYNFSMLNKSATVDTEVSTIYRSNKIFTLFGNGTSPDLDFIIIGPLSATNKLAFSLPKDYDPFR